jgi:Ca2+:H+ antiporter
MLALHKGLVDVVKASITGSVIGNLLLALGLAIFFGGIKHKQQSFNKTGAGMSSALLLVASAASDCASLVSSFHTGHDRWRNARHEFGRGSYFAGGLHPQSRFHFGDP